MAPKSIDISPSASRLTSSLRDIGYDFVTAVADLVDNSVEAGARHIDISFEFAREDSWIRIADDGSGMRPSVLNEALRFGTRRTYTSTELGRYGLGLKTASLSQCRRLIVASRAAPERRRIYARVIDLDYIGRSDSWQALEIPKKKRPSELVEPLSRAPGTVVIWADLDRVFDGLDSIGGHAKRRLDRLAAETMLHLGMVFHRFIDGEVPEREPIKITINDEVVQSWDPFARSESMTESLPVKAFSLTGEKTSGTVTFRPFVLPHRSGFSNQRSFERYAGPKKWNRQQGLYIYRSHRLIQSGGWAGLRAVDEHTKFARAAIEFEPALDELFKVNVAKMKVSLPGQLKSALERSVGELVAAAQARYRRGELAGRRANRESQGDRLPEMSTVGVAIRAAAIEAREIQALRRIEERLRERAGDIAIAIGWDD